MLYQSDLMGSDPRVVLDEWSASGREVPDFTRALVQGVADHLSELDAEIGARSEGWSVDRMASVDRTILRVAAYELLVGRETPVGAAIDEAVRAAKELSTEDSGRFVNGVLGKIARASAGGPPVERE
jgi:transcription antitermination protein NusB